MVCRLNRPPSSLMACSLFLVSSQGMPRSHHAIFIQLNDDGSGHLFNVEGNIQTGMEYKSRVTESPKASETYEGMTQLGWVHASDVSRIEGVCTANPAPEKQFNGARRLYPDRKLRRCQEWTAETVQHLREHGILWGGPSSHTQPTMVDGDPDAPASLEADAKIVRT